MDKVSQQTGDKEVIYETFTFDTNFQASSAEEKSQLSPDEEKTLQNKPELNKKTNNQHHQTKTDPRNRETVSAPASPSGSNRSQDKKPPLSNDQTNHIERIRKARESKEQSNSHSSSSTWAHNCTKHKPKYSRSNSAPAKLDDRPRWRL